MCVAPCLRNYRKNAPAGVACACLNTPQMPFSRFGEMAEALAKHAHKLFVAVHVLVSNRTAAHGGKRSALFDHMLRAGVVSSMYRIIHLIYFVFNFSWASGVSPGRRNFSKSMFRHAEAHAAGAFCQHPDMTETQGVTTKRPYIHSVSSSCISATQRWCPRAVLQLYNVWYTLVSLSCSAFGIGTHEPSVMFQF